jgi:uncharacterized protein
MRYGILAAVMFVALLAAVVVIIDLVRVPNIYAVEGVGEVKYAPDTAEITSSIYTENDVSLEAVKEAAATMRDILAALKATGVAADDIKTAGVRSGLLDLSDNESRAKDARRAYFAEQGVVVQVRDLGMVGKILDAIAQAGSNYWLVTYKVSDRDRLERAARKAAFLDAIAVAEAYAHDGQFTRGRVLKIQDDQVQFPEVDYPNREYRTQSRSNYRGYLARSVEKVTVTGSRNTTIDTTFDVPPPREETVRATTHVLFEID